MASEQRATKRHQSNDDEKINLEFSGSRSNEATASIGDPTNHSEVSYISTLPSEILWRIIRQIPMAQWASLEWVDKKFQKLVHSTWQTVRYSAGSRYRIQLSEIKGKSSQHIELVLGFILKEINGSWSSSKSRSQMDLWFFRFLWWANHQWYDWSPG